MLDQITALNRMTANIIDFTGDMPKAQTARITSRGLEHHSAAFLNEKKGRRS